MLPHEIRQDEEASSNLEASLSAKEKIISELHLELRNVENALSKEREEHLLELKRLNTLVNEKVCAVYKYAWSQNWLLTTLLEFSPARRLAKIVCI